MKSVEILAPAGSVEMMRAAFKAGADAAYIGGHMFGARAFASNPGREALLSAIDEAHLHGRRLYLTVNTLMKEREMQQYLYDYLRPYYEAGLDAVLVQDLGVMAFIQKHFPGLPVHASTQMTVCGEDFAGWLKDKGAARIVAPRELNLEEIRDLKAASGLEIEVFIHGALCYCYSGQCLMSSMIGGRSGNRGRCAQPCRLPYRFDGKTAYWLSPKDLCGLDVLPDLIDAGVDSLKIEGRMKIPEYAAGTTAIYRKYVDLYLEGGRQKYRVADEDRKVLLELYNRGGFNQGYFHAHNGADMMSIDRPNHSGIVIGKGKAAGKSGVRIRLSEDLHQEDLLEMPEGFFVEVQAAQSAGETLSVKTTKKMPEGSFDVMRIRNSLLLSDLHEKYVKNYEINEKIHGFVSLSKDLPATMTVYAGECCVTVTGEIAGAAEKRPLDVETVRRRLMKTGGSAFAFDTLEIQLEDGLFLPLQALNALRRQALEELTKALLRPFRRQLPAERIPEESCNSADGYVNVSSVPGGLHVLVSDPGQLKAAADAEKVTCIIVESFASAEFLSEAEAICRKNSKSFMIALPHIWRDLSRKAVKQRAELFKKLSPDGWLLRNPESLFYLEKEGYQGFKQADYQVYAMNSDGAGQIAGLFDGQTLPVELNMHELSERGMITSSEMLVYGYIPLMVSAQCLLKTAGRCHARPELFYMEDRKKHRLPVQNICSSCYNLIYNTVPLYLPEVVSGGIKGLVPASFRLQFLNEDEGTCRRILEAFSNADPRPVTGAYTRGHYQRGVE